MSADFYDRALRRIKWLTMAVAVAGAAGAFVLRGRGDAAGFLAGAGISYINFELIHGLTGIMGDSGAKAKGWGLLIALRYVLMGVAVYVIVRILGITPVAVLAGLLAAFAAVLLEILYELILHART